MADFQLRVTAETQKAEKDLQRLDKTASEATKSRKLNIDVTELNKNFKNVEKNVKEAGNTIQTFYRISKNIPGIGDRVKEFENLAKGTAELAKNAPASAAALRENAKAGSILSSSLETAGGAAGRLVNSLAKAGFALFAVKEAVGVLKGAFGGFFNETIGREIKLRETILKTQTTLASTNKVFRNGTEITDPYQKIVALTGEVAKRIDSIRERSIALAGVTSNDVIEVFGIVASQVGQIGGGLKEAEDLAINFSAALGTFGIPLYQARQEIGSILRGDITTDSYLAKALGITNEDVAKAKSQAGGVVKFLEERLAAAVAGQRIAAQGFAGVVSNIKDLSELVNQRFGAGLLDPLLGGLTKIFDFLFKIREEVFAISEGMGRGLGQLLSTNLTAITGGSALFGQLGAGAEGFAASLAKSVQSAFASLQANANQVIAPIRNLLEELTKSFGLVAAGLARLAQGFVSIKVENFKALVQIFSNLSEAVTAFSAVLGQVLRAYGQLLQVPFVQYLSQISVQFQLLEKLGVMSAVKLGFAAVGLIAAWKPIVTFFQALVARIAALIGGLVIAVGASFTRIGAIVASFAATLTATYPAAEAFKQQLLGLATSLTAAGAAADKAGVSVTRFGGATAAAAKTASMAMLNFIKFNLILLAIQVGITVLIDLFGRFQRAQEEAARSDRAAEALRRLQTKYKDVGDSADSATKAARDFEQALVDADYAKNLDALEQVREKINQLRYELKPGIQSWREFWEALSGSEVGRFEERSRQALKGLLSEEQGLKDKLSAVDRERDKKTVEEKITLEADKRVSLEKEISDIRKQQEDALFQQRQALAQKEVEIFRTAGELRIFQMEEANKKLIDGEEGASAAALDSLNTYLSTRERGELDIEAAKKSLVIEAANLEREISNYRLENEKKIAEIRKRAGDYEQKVADYRRQLAGQTSVEGQTGLTQGNTGTSSSGPHFHVAGAANEAEARALFDPQIRSQLITTDRPGPPRPGGRTHAGFDLAGPAGTPLNLASGYSLSNFTRDPNGLGGNYATITGPNSKTYKVMHLQDPGAGYKGPGSATAAPKAPSFEDIGAPAVEKYAAAVQALSGAMERLRALQAALTEAKTKAAFDEIAKAAFPRENVEQYKDSLLEARLNFEALANSQGVLDPEKTAAEVRYRKELLVMERERAQIMNRAAQTEGVKRDELIRLEEELNKRIEQRKRDLTEVRNLQVQINAIQKGADLVSRWQNEIQQIEDNNQALRLRARLIAEGVSAKVIEKELAKLQIQQDLEKVTLSLNDALTRQSDIRDRLAKQLAAAAPKDKADLQKQLDEANAEISRLQELIRQLREKYEKRAQEEDNKPPEPRQEENIQDVVDQWKEDIKDMRAELADFARTVQSELANAMANSVFAILDGTGSIQDAFANMFRSIYQSWVKMLTDMIAKWMLVKLIGLFLPATAASPPAATAAPTFAATGATFANGIAEFARGGTFTNSVAHKPTIFAFRNGGSMQAGVMGEAGPEAIMPLRRGAGGRLGVDASGAADNVQVIVNVDAKGSKVQGDDQQGNQLGRVIAAAVQQELIKQKRPGGLLS